MKKSLVLILVLLFCLLTACRGGSLEATLAPSSAPAPPTESLVQSSASASQGKPSKLIWVREGGLVVDFQGQGCTTLPMPEEVEFATEEWGKELKPGMMVELIGGGGLWMSYPGKTTADKLVVTGYDGGLINLYQEVLDDLMARSPELSQGIQYVSYDGRNIWNLTQREWDSIIWFQGSGTEMLTYSLGELEQHGYVEKPDYAWPDGVLLQLATKDETEDSFTLNCTKWRSREQSVKVQYQARRENGLWTWQEAE